jgi:hypothetical protein
VIVRVAQRLKRQRDEARRARDQVLVQNAAYETLIAALFETVAALRSESEE